jgi:hypothetical protein
MSDNPSAVLLATAGRGEVSHDRGQMHDADQSTQKDAQTQTASVPNSETDLNLHEVQEQSTLPSLLDRRSSVGQDPSPDAAVATGAATLAAGSPAIEAGGLNGKIEPDSGRLEEFDWGADL